MPILETVMINSTAEPAPLAVPRQGRYRRFGLHNSRLGFRRWRRSRPFWGGVWAILGGLIILYMPTMAIKLLLASGTTVLVGILNGALIAIFGLFLWFAPSLRQIVGVLIAMLAIASLITADFGGFLIGMIVAAIGGALGFAWVPVEPHLKAWRIRRALHIRLPATQPDLELRGLPTTSADLVGRSRTRRAPANAVEAADAGGDAPTQS